MNLLRRVITGLSAKREFLGPAGKRAYAIGDVHGRLDLLDDVLGRVRADIAARPAAETYLVLLGDLIDRGPDSAGVLERLRTLDIAAKPLFLLGNHEEVLLRVLAAEPRLAYEWLGFGGAECAESYGLEPSRLEAMDEDAIAEALLAAIPPAHVAFLRGFGDTFRFGDYLFVHAGIRPGVRIEDQDLHDLRWIRAPFLTDASDHGVMVIHGHTISERIEERGNRIGIDTGAYRSGQLTALAVEDERRWVLATG